MARDRTAGAAGTSDATVDRIRTLSDRVLEGVREGGEAALQTYERTLHALADYQEAAGGADRSGFRVWRTRRPR